ncbi:uncharacterized protein LOC134234885 [Saccostrea cucullata]|uniref:uncharacterized protein LOC134234885 n=1 Tax=Saccostrea cuccullata TaxID=36930 RepID=UPI002ED37469
MAKSSDKQLTYPSEEVDPFEVLSKKIGHGVEDELEVEKKTSVPEGKLLSHFVTGNQVQLVSKISGRSLRIVQDRVGKLKVDGRGDLGQKEWNAVWTVINEKHNMEIRLHNNFNFLSISNGETKIVHVPEEKEHDRLDTLFLLVLDPENFVALESVKEPENCVGIEANGSLRSAEKTFVHDDHAMFGVHLIKPDAK